MKGKAGILKFLSPKCLSWWKSINFFQPILSKFLDCCCLGSAIKSDLLHRSASLGSSRLPISRLDGALSKISEKLSTTRSVSETIGPNLKLEDRFTADVGLDEVGNPELCRDCSGPSWKKIWQMVGSARVGLLWKSLLPILSHLFWIWLYSKTGRSFEGSLKSL